MGSSVCIEACKCLSVFGIFSTVPSITSINRVQTSFADRTSLLSLPASVMNALNKAQEEASVTKWAPVWESSVLPLRVRANALFYTKSCCMICCGCTFAKLQALYLNFLHWRNVTRAFEVALKFLRFELSSSSFKRDWAFATFSCVYVRIWAVRPCMLYKYSSTVKSCSTLLRRSCTPPSFFFLQLSLWLC